jgi:hypothetical protein
LGAGAARFALRAWASEADNEGGPWQGARHRNVTLVALNEDEARSLRHWLGVCTDLAERGRRAVRAGDGAVLGELLRRRELALEQLARAVGEHLGRGPMDCGVDIGRATEEALKADAGLVDACAECGLARRGRPYARRAAGGQMPGAGAEWRA